MDIPGSVETNPLDKPQLPPINPPTPPDNGRPKTSNPNFRSVRLCSLSVDFNPFSPLGRDPRKLPKMIGSSSTETKYRPDNGHLQETLDEEEEEEEEVAGDKHENGEEDADVDADDEAEVTDIRKDGEKEEIKSEETKDVEVNAEMIETRGR